MRINFIGYYMQYDGYGRFSCRLIKSLQDEGVKVKIATPTYVTMPDWMLHQEGVDWGNLTISCLPPTLLQKVPGRHWYFTMAESSAIHPDWVERINNSGVERVIVPCHHNALAFKQSGVTLPISVVPGGTDPNEFPLRQQPEPRPYTFLTLADRGFRKGWEEVWKAFYLAFGGKTGGDKDVRLIIKVRPMNIPDTVSVMRQAGERDERVIYQVDDALDMYEIYNQADCVALPSRCEGWGMPHREAASMGIPVITQVYGGLDDGFTHKWSLPVAGGKIKPVPAESKYARGECMVANVDALAELMFWCYRNPDKADAGARLASQWLHQNQTWQHTARNLLGLIEGEPDALPVVRPTVRHTDRDAERVH